MLKFTFQKADFGTNIADKVHSVVCYCARFQVHPLQKIQERNPALFGHFHSRGMEVSK